MSKQAYSFLIAGLMMMSAGAASACGVDRADESASLQANPEDTLVLVSGISDKQAVDVAPSVSEESATFTY